MLWMVPLLPMLAAPLIYVSGRRGGRARPSLLALLSVAAVLVLAALAIAHDWRGRYALNAVLDLRLGLTPLSGIVALAVPLIALPILLFAAAHERPPLGRLLAIMVAFVGAMELLVLAEDLLTLLVGWELIGACSWALISHHWQDTSAPREAIQAFIVTRFGDLGLYIAAGAVFAGSQGFGYQQLSGLDNGLMQVAAAGILLAAAAKSAQLPFSAWLFAAMAGPVPVSALLHAATLVAAGFYLLARLQPSLTDVVWLMPAIVTLGLSTALAGGLVAAAQGHAKKLLAASTSAQYGLMWVAVGIGYPGVALLHFLAHGVFKAGLFLVTGVAERQTGSYRLADMRLGSRLPGLALLSAILAMALAGLAPLGAAWTKEQIVSVAYEVSLWLALGVALAGGLSALYATRFQLAMFGRSRRRELGPPRIHWAERLAVGAAVGVTLALSVLWWPEAQSWLRGSLGLAHVDSHFWLLVLSLALVVLGIALGWGLTRWGQAWMWAWPVARWWGLVPLTRDIGTAVVRLGTSLARFDGEVLEAATHALAARARRTAQGLARGDDELEAGTHALAARTRCAALGLARGDDELLDAGVRGRDNAASWEDDSHQALTRWLPGSLSGAIGQAGHWARQAQTGQSHHYYAAIAIGFALVLIILLLGDLS
ncbi:NADH-quinone oxidoreductase subunit L [Halomonas stenophila]|uniref:NADH:ubiquinone oxidoreductase subunit 5 (Subunit L)/multisubunit Na+/H+ antiporter MnhA subunit n=1 Tax=Halomonas stenophila TaxID=795312 RepID=A0A7W5EVC0_9GAMM|nr:proton-conducting transporter membrane subunit [Halomonas stenophila]MBB3231406.1 NADH:ubiquinone oxidoreductase subunit 5 (subunit L)/multisubunit Na+/H+ antiporter MnhA subunit [Halomonas stenophila]